MNPEDNAAGTSSDQEHVFRTARGAYRYALYDAAVVVIYGGLFLAISLAWWREKFWWMPWAVVAWCLPWLLRGTWYFMQARYSKAIASDAGLLVVNWRKAQKFIPWENLVGIKEPRPATGVRWLFVWQLREGWIRAEVEDSMTGHRRQMIVARWFFRRPPAMDTLRDEILVRRGFSEVPRVQDSAILRAIEWLVGEAVLTWRE
jgi:hypothetical protein